VRYWDAGTCGSGREISCSVGANLICFESEILQSRWCHMVGIDLLREKRSTSWWMKSEVNEQDGRETHWTCEKRIWRETHWTTVRFSSYLDQRCSLLKAVQFLHLIAEIPSLTLTGPSDYYI
jgi:5-hydroxyisourate hydrolase-like protein (transthyretin family)